jgi:hypothetical protein
LLTYDAVPELMGIIWKSKAIFVTTNVRKIEESLAVPEFS